MIWQGHALFSIREHLLLKTLIFIVNGNNHPCRKTCLSHALSVISFAGNKGSGNEEGRWSPVTQWWDAALQRLVERGGGRKKKKKKLGTRAEVEIGVTTGLDLPVVSVNVPDIVCWRKGVMRASHRFWKLPLADLEKKISRADYEKVYSLLHLPQLRSAHWSDWNQKERGAGCL